MKKTLFLVLLLLAVIAAMYYLKPDEAEQSSILKYERNFKIENVDRVAKIFIAHKDGKHFTLLKGPAYWTLKGRRVSDGAMKNVLMTLRSMEISYMPTKAAYKNIMKHMIHSGIKVEVYDENDRKMKVYYIGGMPPSELGTYVMLEGSEQPFVVQRKFVEGSIRPVFQLNEDEWYDQAFFRLKPDEIKSIKVAYPYDQQNSFELKRNVEGEMNLVPLYPTQEQIKLEPNPGLIDIYLSKFEEINSEAIINRFPLKDSIVQLVPFCSIELLTTQDELIAIKMYPKNEFYRDINMDREFWNSGRIFRYYAQLNNGDFIIVQQLNIGKVLWKYPEFFRIKRE